MGKNGSDGKLGKLKCMLKRWRSSSKITRSAATGSSSSFRSSGSSSRSAVEVDEAWRSASFHGADAIPSGLHPVYVGKSRRRYLVSSNLMNNALFRILVERSGGSDGAAGAAGAVVGCEVVLFEHLLWVLESADPQTDSLEELVDYYSCC